MPGIIVTGDKSVPLDELLQEADREAELGHDEKAIALYHQVITGDTTGLYRRRALFGLAFVYDRAGRPDQAVDAYLNVVDSGKLGEPDADEARVRAVRLLLFLDRLLEADEVARPLDPKTRTALEQAALRAARALGDLERGELEAAHGEISRGQASLEAAGFAPLIDVPLDVAALEYARGEWLRAKADQIHFKPLPPDFAAALEARCQLILDAQAAYSEAMKSKSAQYAAKSGVRVGQLYQSLHTDLVGMGTPSAVSSEEKRLLFEGALRLRYSILLIKAKAMMTSTVSLIERSGEGGAWATRAREVLDEISRAERVEQALIDALPVSRSELEAALAELEARARREQGGSPSAAKPDAKAN